jgi:hypothetical protein
MTDTYYPRNKKAIFQYPDNGYDYDQVLAKKHLKLGDTYHVSKIVEHGWHTVYFFKEIPGVGFNSVLFEM